MADSRKERVLGVLELFARLGLGGLFAFSALGKIGDPALFADLVGRYEMLPRIVLGPFALVLPMVELLSGLTLVFTVWVREAALLVVAQLGMFMVALSQALVRGLDISCGCFGVPSTGGALELAMALVRDAVLLVPAIWLLFRPNGWLFSTLAVKRTAVLVLALVPMFLSAHPASDGPARRGEWNSSFLKTFEQAQKNRKPMVLFCRRNRCVFCARLERVCHSDLFLKWQKQHAPYLANILVSDKTEDVRAAEAFIAAVTNLVDFPQVCVWTPLADGGARTNVFVGQRGYMPGVSNPSLAVEFTTALERILADADGSTSDTVIETNNIRKVSFKVAGGEGTVDMTPKSGEICDNFESVFLQAKPGRDSAFLCWRDPSGAEVGNFPRYCVRGTMPIGCYTAEFRNRKDIAPPAVTFPATSLVAKVGHPFRYDFPINEACRPLSFRVRMPPPGIVIHPICGSVYGTPHQAGTYRMEISVKGNDPKRTGVKGTVTIVVEEGDGKRGD